MVHSSAAGRHRSGPQSYRYRRAQPSARPERAPAPCSAHSALLCLHPLGQPTRTVQGQGSCVQQVRPTTPAENNTAASWSPTVMSLAGRSQVRSLGLAPVFEQGWQGRVAAGVVRPQPRGADLPKSHIAAAAASIWLAHKCCKPASVQTSRVLCHTQMTQHQSHPAPTLVNPLLHHSPLPPPCPLPSLPAVLGVIPCRVTAAAYSTATAGPSTLEQAAAPAHPCAPNTARPSSHMYIIHGQAHCALHQQSLGPSRTHHALSSTS